MRKYTFIASAVLVALTACSKIEPKGAEERHEVSFAVANFLRTRAEAGVKYDNGSFGTYSWFSTGDPFMGNEEVDLVGGIWKTSKHTYYWPKSGSLDFISYSPFSGPQPVIEKDGSEYTLSYSDYKVADVDVMYADLVNCSSNVDEVTDDADGSADSGYTGVPTLFRHALAKVSFMIQANFLSYGGTTWEMTVTDARLNGIYTSGDCSLTWNGTEWEKPAGNVWSNPGDQEIKALTNGLQLTEEPQPLSSLGDFVLPQSLVGGSQNITLTIHIKTTLPDGKVIEEDYRTGNLALAGLSGGPTAWEMNQNIIYVIRIKPTATTDEGNPDNPEDATILFDPAVSGWDEYQADIVIQL